MSRISVTSGPISLVALGANLPSDATGPEVTLRQAIKCLADSQTAVESVSRLYRTPSFPAGAGPDYINAAVALRGLSDPQALLHRLHRIEADFGRERHARWASRTLDLDLIACGDAVLPDRTTQDEWRSLSLDAQQSRAPKQLILPHPRLQDRAFVLVPLMDIAPNWRHPVLGQSVAEMVTTLSKADIEAVKPL